MILSDRSIKEAIAAGRLGIDPFDPELVQPSSIDVRLDTKFLVFRNTKRAYIDVKQPADDLMEMIEVSPDEPMFLHPHEFILGSTVERVRMPDDLVALYEKLRAHKGGVAAAALHQRRCTGCQLGIDNAELAVIARAPADPPRPAPWWRRRPRS